MKCSLRDSGRLRSLAALLVWAALLPAADGEDYSLETSVMSSAIRMDTVPLAAAAAPSDPMLYEFRRFGGNPLRLDLGVPAAFTERATLQTRRELADGLTVVNAVALGLNRTGSVWRTLQTRGNDEEQSLLSADTALEVAPTGWLTIRASTRFAREVDDLGGIRSDWSGGVDLVVVPRQGTSFNAGIYRSQSLDTPYGSNVLVAGFDSQIGEAVTISVSGWSSQGEEGRFSSAGAVGSLGWQCSKQLWLGAGAACDTSDGWGTAYSMCRYYLSTVLQTSPDVSFGLEVSRLMGTYQGTDDARTEGFAQTAFIVSRRQQLTANFSTKLSAEFDVASKLARALAAAPLFRMAGHFDF